MDKKPLVSIVMPIYGVEKYIEGSVKSVINQTYDNIELILVDDGSLDKSVEIAERVLKENIFPYQLIRQINQGQGKARNNGMKKASGEWIMFLDSDDILLPETVKELLDSAVRKDADMVFSEYRIIRDASDVVDDKSEFLKYEINAKELQRRFLLRDNIVLVVGTLFRNDLIKEKGLTFESIPWSEDQHFVWKYLSFINNAVFVEKEYYQYFQHSGSIMTASGIDKMTQSYPAICDLPKYYENNQLISKFLVARWVMGTLNAAARITEYENLIKLFQQLNGVYHLNMLLRFPSIKVRLAALLCLISKKKYYSRIRIK